MQKGFLSREQVAEIKENFPKGTRIRLNSMSDPYAPVESGTEGEVTSVDSIGTLHMKWSNGRSLGLVFGEDSFTVLSRPEQEQSGMGGIN